MDRGKKLVALAKNLKTAERDSEQSKIRKNKSVRPFFFEDGEVLREFPNETASCYNGSFDPEKICELRQHASGQLNNIDSDQSEEDVFHETDYNDSDYVPSNNSGFNSTSESIRMMADVIDSNLSDTVSPKFREDILLANPKPTSIKKTNKMNKNLGKEYTTWKNKTVPAKKTEKLVDCYKKCNTKISLEQQKKIFVSYWKMGNYNSRRQYLAGMIHVERKKSATLRKAPKPRNREFVYLYHFEINGHKTSVCKKCFLKIFGETDQSIKTICRMKVQGKFNGSLENDRRGKHPPHHKLSTEKFNEVLEHINSIPKYQSHYSRRHTSQLYFQRGLNLALLYRLYKEKYTEPVSESKYQEIFHQLNIKFKKPQTDLCNTCEIFKSHLKNTSDENEKEPLLMQQREHHDDADFAYNCKKMDKDVASRHVNVKMFSFDLQQCLPTPYLNASMFFYKRPLWTFNLTIHDGETKKANCYIWHELIAKRGANDIGSCIFKCLMSLPDTITHVIMYSDSCPGQNRNSYISAMFEQVVEKHPTIATIDHKFLVVGHTHLECDTVHAQIERKKKNMSGSIQHPHDWANLIDATNNKFIVHEMSQKEFFDFSSLLKVNYTWRNRNSKGDKFEWKNVRWMRYEKNKPGVLQYKSSLKPEVEFKELDINPRRSAKSISELKLSYTSPLTVSKNKKQDLLDMLPLINTDFHKFYKDIAAEGECQVESDSDLDSEEDN